ncbi:MAG: O-antigen ligase family protein, partial [Acidimicrobiia bacterium]|nr:O-antigen ligase family protein [Acidimicrobiia bacterium]
MTILSDPSPASALTEVERLGTTGSSSVGLRGVGSPGPAKPSWLERPMVVLTVFVLIHDLPIDWLRDRQAFLEQDGNTRVIAVQLLLMIIGIARVAGLFNWLIRVFRLDMTIIGLAGLAVLSTLWSDAPVDTLKQSIILAVTTLYAAYLVLRFDLGEILELMCRMFVISGLVNLAFIFAFPAYGIDEFGLWDGVFYQKNALGFVAMISIPMLLMVGRSGPPWRFVYYLCVPLQFALLLGSQSKTMLVATLGSVLLMFIYRTFRGRRTLRGAVIISLGLMSLITVAFATANIALLADWLDKDVTLTGRIPLWEGLIPVVVERPFFGYGYKAAFRGYFSPVHEVWVSEGWEPTHAHNAVLQTWLELGVIGVGLMVFGVLRVTVRAM